MGVRTPVEQTEGFYFIRQKAYGLTSKLRDCVVAMGINQKWTLTELLAMTIKRRLLRRYGHQLKNEH